MTKVLVVDDSAVDRRLAGGLLAKRPEVEVLFAENGVQALKTLGASPVDLVITDLVMPEMDGLELVRAVRVRHPGVPVLLMTGQGSESIAIEALEHGATSYVPKSRLADKLLEAMDQVASLARTQRSHERLAHCLTNAEFRFELDNDPALVSPLVDFLQQFLSQTRLCDETGRIRAGVALEEALLNALYHGNLELSSEELAEASSSLVSGQPNLIDERRNQPPYRDRRVAAFAVLTPSEARFVIRDEGPGFDRHSVPDPLSGDPQSADSLERESGRGLMLMRTFMDEVHFNDTGNEVTMIKRRDRGDSPVAAQTETSRA